MKTRYKYIHFEQSSLEIEKNGTRWWCNNTRHGDLLGFAEYYPDWKTHIFAPANGIIFSADCLRDIAKFLEQLNEAKK